VRELRSAVQRAYVMTDGAVIDEQWLPNAHAGSPQPYADQPAAVTPAEAPLAVVTRNAATVTLPIGSSLAQMERTMVLATLTHHQNHRERAAAALGISLKTLYNRLKDFAAQEADGDATR